MDALITYVSAHSSGAANRESSTSYANGRLDELTLDGHALDAASLPTAAVRREAETTDAPAGSHSGAQNVVGVKVVSTLLKTRLKLAADHFETLNPIRCTRRRDAEYLEVVWVQVSLVFVCGFISTMTVLNDGIQKIFEHLIRLLVSSNAAHRHDERMSWNTTDQQSDKSWTLIICCSDKKKVLDISKNIDGKQIGRQLNIATPHVCYRTLGLAAIMRLNTTLPLLDFTYNLMLLIMSQMHENTYTEVHNMH